MHGASVKNVDGRNRTALHYAAASGSLECTKLLLDCNADIHARGDMNETPLAAAILQDQAEVAVYLLKRGAEIDCVANDSHALRLAALKNSHETLQALLDYGLDVDCAQVVKYTQECFFLLALCSGGEWNCSACSIYAFRCAYDGDLAQGRR